MLFALLFQNIFIIGYINIIVQLIILLDL